MHASMTPFQVILLFAALWIAQLVGGGPVIVSETRRDVASPPVLVPNSTTVWVIGETQTVVWDTSNLPEQITNPLGRVLLGFLTDTSDSLNLMIDSPLATGFNITSGSVDITVPDVEPRIDYIIVLMGDSGNRSDRFTITNSTSTPSPTVSASPSEAPGSTDSEASTSELDSSPETTALLPTLSSAHVVTFTDASTAIESPTTATLESLSSQASTLLSGSAPAPASESTSASDTSASAIQTPSLKFAMSMILVLCAFILV